MRAGKYTCTAQDVLNWSSSPATVTLSVEAEACPVRPEFALDATVKTQVRVQSQRGSWILFFFFALLRRAFCCRVTETNVFCTRDAQLATKEYARGVVNAMVQEAAKLGVCSD
jgi:hypothetical protein